MTKTDQVSEGQTRPNYADNRPGRTRTAAEDCNDEVDEEVTDASETPAATYMYYQCVLEYVSTRLIQFNCLIAHIICSGVKATMVIYFGLLTPCAVLGPATRNRNIVKSLQYQSIDVNSHH